MAELPNASAYRSVAGPSRVRAFPCPSFAAPSFAALLLRRSSPSCACPSPSEAQPCISVASPGKANLFLRSSRLSRASPSPGCAPLCSSLPSLARANQSASPATPFTSAPSRCSAKPRKSFAAHIVAVPSHFAQGLATLFRRTASLCRADPSPHNASHGSSVAHHRNAPLSRRYSGSEPSVHSKRPLPLLRHWPMPRNWP